MAAKRSLRTARTPKGKARTAKSKRAQPSKLDARLKLPARAGGLLTNIRPSAKQLQQFIPPASIISVKSGIATRGQRLLTGGLPGFRWDVPAPDPSLGTVVWMTLGFDWAFYTWRSDRPTPTAQPFRLTGSVDWRWVLTGHPSLFPDAPIFLTDNGHYSFYMDIRPGGAGGFDVGWLAPPASGSYSGVPLQQLLATNVNAELKLWMGFDHRNIVLSPNGGYALGGGGPNVLYYSYAYAASVAGMPREGLLVISNS